MTDFETISNLILNAQDNIIHSLTELTGDHYKGEHVRDDDINLRRANYYCSGRVIEKGGIHFIKKRDTLSPHLVNMIKQVKGGEKVEIKSDMYEVTGLSLILHPTNPHVPTMHLNVRYFEVGDIWWFGGGIDISPSYFNTKDIKAFHLELKDICETHDFDYEKFKTQCDDYFYLKTRKQTRGLGGIFFDGLDSNKEKCLNFITKLANEFPKIYTPFLAYKDKPYGDIERSYSLLRRGFYAEFIYVYDKGIKFGFETSIHIKSMFSALPPVLKYDDDWDLTEEQKKLDEFFSKKIDWVHYKE